MRTAQSILVTRPLWEFAQSYSSEFQQDIWRVVLMRRMFSETRRHALWTVLAPSGLVLALLPVLAVRYEWTQYAVCLFLFTLVLATHRFGTRLRSIAWEAKRLYRLRPHLWREVGPTLTRLLESERPSERTLRVQVAPPDAQ